MLTTLGRTAEPAATIAMMFVSYWAVSNSDNVQVFDDGVGHRRI